MPSVAQRLLLLVSSVALGGCLIPPCELGIGIGVTNADASRKAPQRTFQFRAGFHPQQLVRSEVNRKLDLGAGVVVDGTFHERTMTSLYAEGLGVAKQEPLGGSAIARLDAGGQARLTWDSTRAVIRPGIEPIMKAEVSRFVSSALGDRNGVAQGAVHGEMGAGLYVGGYFGGSIWAVTSGLFLRVPAFAYTLNVAEH
jgi:hypothetical protein